ncbi:hypothetical protein [uncultured Shewanella sp.]|uniref:hypothetical protein n=1 Tax=Shewanella atlantica TaxID=271099 RepID=UPI00260BC3FE|nr:hypothetical protein [uncultured Shewanella sp.]
MCSTPKTDLSAKMPKRPFRSFMATMTLKQRKRFALVANRAEERRAIRDEYRRRIDHKAQSQKLSHPSPSLLERLRSLCEQTFKLMG